jgi:DNA-binding response OmpR family regulator
MVFFIMNIHIFEPDADIGDTLLSVISLLGHHAFVANTYQDALKLLFTLPAEVVILSKHLRGGQIDHLIKEAKQRGCKVVCISTDKIDETGCDTFIREPFDIDELENAIMLK